MSKPRLLVVGDGGAPTGFARVVESIFLRLHELYDVHHLAVNYHGDPYEIPWPLYPAAIGGDGHGVSRIEELLRRIGPDLIFMVNDLWVQKRYIESIRKTSKCVPVVVYAPVDAEPLAPEWVSNLALADCCVLYTDYGIRAVREALRGEKQPRLLTIPHGVDTAVFFEMDTARAKVDLGVTRSQDEPSFVVLNANRNQPRKRIDLTMKGFAEFAHGKPDWVRLFLHMGRQDMGWNIVELGRRLGISKRMIISGPASGACPRLSTEKLNLVYNASDVGLNTSGGEGWGLTAFEHAATGAPQVLPRHSASEEIWDGRALLIDAPVTATDPKTLLDFRYTTPDRIAKALQRLYESSVLATDTGHAGQRVATDPRYSWDSIAARWHALFEKVLDCPEIGTDSTLTGVSHELAC